MKITDIKRQVKRADRYSIYVDEKYVFSLSDNELLQIGLFVGQEFDEGELEKLKQSAVLDKAYSRSIDLLARRARSEWELRQYLVRKEYEADVVEQTLTRLSASGYVNDKQFAESWVNTRHLLKATSKRRLQQELRQKHISSETIDEVLEEDETDERQVLRDLVAKKRQQTKYQDDLKLMQYLSRQGFDYGDIKDALSANDDY